MLIFDSLGDPKLAGLLKKSAVGVIPTDTVYGLVCSAGDEEAAARLYSVKLRDSKPGTIIAADIGQLVALGLKQRYLKAVEQFWPNPISIIVPCGDELEYLHQGKRSLAVRVTADEEVRKLLISTGPLLTTSANMPGEPEAKNAEEAKNIFKDRIDFVVDGGDLSGRASSTVIRILDDAVDILRQGAVKISEKGEIINENG
jgi:L-threonylcarbamoyladenylate synthase